MKKLVMIGFSVMAFAIGFHVGYDLPFMKKLKEENKRQQEEVDRMLDDISKTVNAEMQKQAEEILKNKDNYKTDQ